MVKKRNIWLETQCSETKKELDRTIKHSAVQSQEITDLKQVSNDQSIQISSYEATCAVDLIKLELSTRE